MKNLVIVESPAKAKTIEKFLGKDYKVMSSYGHIRDLRKKDFSIDIDNDYSPEYEIPADKADLVKQLKAASSKAEMVWLASDEDREGEAIAWHLYEVLGLKPDNTRRIVFHEITKPAILGAIENPRGIDIDRVNAQQARRVLDRIVGFELSPVLWTKIKPSLSAGRVQSVAVRLICERENEIRAFRPEEFYRVNAVFSTPRAGEQIKAELNRRLSGRDKAKELLELYRTATFTVGDIDVKPVSRSPQPPFTTSTLQQEAARRLGMSVAQTMSVAQKLYEAGLITYMRTDSLNLSDLALRDIAGLIGNRWGDAYLKVRHYHTKSKGAQEAHEAIRPTYIDRETIDGTPAEKRLYELIRMRTLASQMADAELERTNVDIVNDRGPEVFQAHGEVVTFDGFMKVYGRESVAGLTMLPPLTKGERLEADSITATQRFTQAPPRYNEGTLVKKMEELGIGRPSTYAPTISTIQTRDYIRRGENEGAPRQYETLILKGGQISEETLTENTGGDKGRLVPTDVGMVVNEFLTENFPDILDYNFTARVEEKFDEISQGMLPWQNEIADFYRNFHPVIETVRSERSEHKVGERRLGVDPESGKPVSVKIGRYGPLVQIGDAGDEEKPRFAALLKGQSIATITLEEALKLFELPRTLGKYEDKVVVAAIGRFGPYIRHDGAFVSLGKDLDPRTVTLEQAIELIDKKREEARNRLIKKFDDNPNLEVLNGRFGPYLAYKKEGAKKAANYRLPKDVDPATLTEEAAMEIIKAKDAEPAKPRRATRKKQG